MTPLKHSMPLVNSSDHIPKLYLIDNHILYNSVQKQFIVSYGFIISHKRKCGNTFI